MFPATPQNPQLLPDSCGSISACLYFQERRTIPAHQNVSLVPRRLCAWPAAGRGILMRQSFTVGIGGAAGQGVATPGDIFAKIFSRRGLHVNAYNAYQSIIRGGHTFLTIRTGPEKISNT